MALSWQVIRTDSVNLWRQPILLTGELDAILIDGPLTDTAGERVVAAIRASGRTLRRVVVTCHDPDYYFGLTPVRAAYPDVPVFAPRPIADKIAATVHNKFGFARRRLGADGPESLDEIVLPTPFDDDRLWLEGEEIHIVAARQPLNFHLWLPTERAILGGVQVSGANHVWMADTPTAADRAPWLADLAAMAALAPSAAASGHAPPGSPEGIDAIRATRDYIRAFDEEAARAADAATLIAAMTARYPTLGLPHILDLGARVCMGELRWP